MKVLTVIGTRPEAIKMAPVVRELRRRRDAGLQSVLCVTGQHRQMLDPVLQLFQLTPDHDLNIMRPDQTLPGAAAAVLGGLEPIFRRERPDWVLVQGDTTTVAAAALGAAYCGCRVGHVEAGLRTYNRRRPFPEEINRRIAGVVADLHFAPTQRARANLIGEGVPQSAILVTGNTGIDALRWAASLPAPPELSPLLRALGLAPSESDLRLIASSPHRLPPSSPRLILVTAHRRENFGAPLEQVCLAVRDLAQRYGPELRILYPVHLNPHVSEPVQRLLSDTPGVLLTPPLDYLTLVHILQRATLVLTDSGGIQEDAPSVGKPVLVLRDTTERPEAVEAGVARLVGADRSRIVAETVRLLDDPDAYAAMARNVSPYGDGQAAGRIVSRLLDD